MNRRFLFCSVVLLSAQIVSGQALPGKGPAVPAVPQAPAAPAQGLTDEMRAFLKEMGAAYRAAKSYRDAGRAVVVQVNGKVKTTTEVPMSLLFVRPNLMRLDAGQFEAGCDGKQLYFAVPSARQYTLAPAPGALDRRALPSGSVMGGTEEGHPEILDLLMREDAPAAIMTHIRRIAWLPDIPVAERPCRVLSWETMTTRLTIFVDKERHTILRATGESLPGAEGTEVASVRMTYEFAPVEFNVDIKPEEFALNIPKDYQQMREIGGEAMPGAATKQPEARTLTGTKIPEFGGTDLSGTALKPDEFKDRALLLFFWTAAGSEHSLTSIPMIQQIADKYKENAGIAVLGVNTDQAPIPLAPQMLERKKANFRCLTDESYALRKLFKLEGVPTFILAGPDGVIRWSKLGAPPDLRTELEAEIAKLLAVPGK